MRIGLKGFCDIRNLVLHGFYEFAHLGDLAAKRLQFAALGSHSVTSKFAPSFGPGHVAAMRA